MQPETPTENRRRAMKKSTRKSAAITALLIAFAVPALAQFEVAPDQFAEPEPSARTKLQDQIFEQKSALESYQAAIAAKAKEVEQAHAFLDTPGGIEDMANAQLRAYQQECELSALRNSLAEPIRVAQAKLAELTGELTVASTEKPAGNATTAPIQRASVHKAHGNINSQPILRAAMR
jgi:hypothetical protein